MGRRAKRANKPVRRRKNRAGRGSSSKTRVSNVIRNNSTVSVRVPAIRDFTVYSAQPSSSVDLESACDVTANKSVWLDALKAIGVFALKIFLAALTTAETVVVRGERYSASKQYIASAVQSVFIGVEDLLWSSPLVERESRKTANKTFDIPCVDYRQARMTNAIIRLTPGSEWAKRAGRYAACCLNISEEEIASYFPTKNTSALRRHDGWTFQEVVQMPGAVVATFGTPLTLRWRAHPYSYANRYLSIGQPDIDGWDFTENLLGGKPSFRLVIAYQSFASAAGDVVDTYSPNDALVQVDIRANIALLESGRSYIRSWPLTTMDTSSAGVYGPHGKVCDSVAMSELRMVNGTLYHVKKEELRLEDLSMDG